MADFIIDPNDIRSKEIVWEHLREQKKPFLLKTEKIEKRSIDYCKYYFGVIIEYISNETGQDPLEIHNTLAQRFLALSKNTRRSTASLTNAEFKVYTTQCRIWAYEVLKMKIPIPENAIL